VHTYYQDIRAEVTTLPKYGKLTETVRSGEEGEGLKVGQWKESFEVRVRVRVRVTIRVRS
jgi:hypothetical protein